ncbi:hypothetical protein F5Y19DRAFT_111008 [Xylariaceae sp. FL1651]|nr:hypothetical protein F5Y19DRAFT_111008 [Xylariaceae sp. FL1651]
MANPRDIARANWGNAQKIRSDILGKLSSLKKERGAVNYTTRFEEAEQTMAEFRLACMQVIFHDFEYAVAKKVEHSLWQCHTFLNGEYRKALSRLMTQNQVVQRRKLDKLYRGFLKTSESFYVVYIQQLSNRFSIPELRQVALGAEAQPKENTAEDISPPAAMRALILKSCQTTLVRLGDLARYRCQMSDKVSKAAFEKASDYYGLANTLDPEDGSAHHQSAVLHQILDQHFDIVYHFHRAISISKPHELALSNLEREFKSPETSSQARNGPVKDPSEAMVTWFVRLHAFFFHGKQFSQHSELEEEVLHRVEIALKNEGTDTMLLKMIIINMAAYDISTEKVKSSWTMERSQSCQFLLRFNIRMILILLRTLDNTLRDETARGIDSGGESVDGESYISFAPSLLKLLPLFRLYLAWVYVTRADLVQYQEYLEPHVKEFYRLLADVLTFLNLYIDPTTEIVSSKYLLPEDSEAQGLRVLSDRKLPLFVYVEEQGNPSQPKRIKTRKPQQNVFGRRFKQETETVWRIRDIICCGVFLAGSAKFPLALMIQSHHGRDTETWVYEDGAVTPASSNEAELSRLLSKLHAGDFRSSSENSAMKEINSARTDNPANGHIQVQENRQRASVSNKSDNMSAKGKALKTPSMAYHDSDLSEDSEMINMVNKLLDPVDEDRPQSSQAQAEPSYGMDSSMANEVFGNIQASPVQPSPVSKSIPSLPWDYFYKPTPHRSSSQEQNQLCLSDHNVPRSAATQLDGFSSSSYLNDLGAPFNQVRPSAMPSRPSTGYIQSARASGVPSPSIPRKSHELDTLEDSRNAVLDSLTSALLAQHGLTRNNSPPENNLLNRTNLSPIWGQRSASGTSEFSFPQATASPRASASKYDEMPSYLEHSATQQASAASLQNPLGPPGQGRPGARQAAPGERVSHLPTTMYPVRNNLDTQHIWAQGSSGNQQQHSPWHYEPSTGTSSLAFSHPSSLLVGTPAAVSVEPANSVACNGHYYNATTPFGRLGGGINNREDPTHFRNQLRAVVGPVDLSYDQQVLQAAMMDNNHKPRPK